MMKPDTFSTLVVLFTIVVAGRAGAADTPATASGGPATPDTGAGTESVRPGVIALDLGAFREEIAIVERELAGESGFSRQDLLLMHSRSAAASGRFAVAAAGYAMFLTEFGTTHPQAERVALRLADCLFPLNYKSIDTLHEPGGPRMQPNWRMEYTPTPARLRQAVDAYELAAAISGDTAARGIALLRLGWVHRVLNDWPASTAAWDRCAKDAPETPAAADALWLAAENLTWNKQPAEAVERLRSLLDDYPRDARADAIPERMAELEAEAYRGAEWLADPVGSLQAEIKARSRERSPDEVYRAVARWLQRRGERPALLAVARWACGQQDWPLAARIACREELVDALLSAPAVTSAERSEAAARLCEVFELTPDDASAVQTAIRLKRLLLEAGQPERADQILALAAKRVRGAERWEPMVLVEQIDSLLKRGNLERAKEVRAALLATYPDYDVDARFEGVFASPDKEGSR
ncbi:MAG TPA: tetratricopeptide repeat protein [Phycisphaerae bacterium]|nr:tetratricopeptide repeat protein [Phycisphaerae bacterium]HNU46524.1 tetratricopeptide repeat protein [Phycisphaerae bacterium]